MKQSLATSAEKSTAQTRTSKAEGFRLQRLEVYNWGTFHHKVASLSLDGQGALLTGDNGSGKSTLVDALLTLLVPNKKRNYNLSSGSERRERSEVSYVRGAYGREQNEFNKGQSKYLRDEDQYSVLIAHFQNPGTDALICLAQFFWFDETGLRKFFVVSHQPLKVGPHFAKFKTPSELKSSLKGLPTTTIFSSFSDYEAYFVKFVGLRSSRALDLFNQITTIKEVGRLNDFVRGHMLDLPDFDEALGQLHQNYLNLTQAHEAIVLAKRQLAELEPIAEAGQSFRSVQEKIHEYETLRNNMVSYFDGQRQGLLQAAIQTRASSVGEYENALVQLTGQQKALESESRELEIALNQDGVGQTLDKIDLLIRQEQSRLDERSKSRADYLKLASGAGIKTDGSRGQFIDAQRSAVKLTDELRAILNTDQMTLFGLEQARTENESRLKQLQLEQDAARRQKSQIPHRYLELRQQLAETLGIKTSAVPFVAELLRVSPEESDWEPAIEKVLGGFGLRLLVSDEHYSAVNRYLAKTNVGMKIVYHRVPEASPQSKRFDKTTKKNYLPAKMEFKQKAGDFGAWIQDKIWQDYDYLCAETMAEFQKHDKAITLTGLVKRGTHHEKDDRFTGHDRSRFILGWDNTERLAYLESCVNDARVKLNRDNKDLSETVTRIATGQKKLQCLASFSGIAMFEPIDVESPQNEIERLQKSKQLINSQGSGQHKLRNRIEEMRKIYDDGRKKRDVLVGQIGVLRSEIAGFERQLTAMSVVPLSAEIALSIEGYLKSQKIKIQPEDLFGLERNYRDVAAAIESHLKQTQSKLSTLQTSLLKKMSQFRMLFPEQSAKLEVSVDYFDSYLEIKATLERESLPDHERRFKNLLNKNVVGDMLAFKSTLESAFEDVQESIRRLNDSLKLIPYSKTTHVQICVEPTRDIDIREFQSMLNAALVTRNGGGMDYDDSFARIKKILDRLLTEARWQEKVTDVRYWGDFHIAELFADGTGQKNYYSDSAGLSGGQKAKLAFTILASAIAYQFGLNDNHQQSDKSFRFVVIDEAFSKSDETNSRFAMELFELLGLQLMVVTPRDKVHVVEPHVKKIFLAEINEAQTHSSIGFMDVEEFIPHEILSPKMSPKMSSKISTKLEQTIPL